MLEFLDFHEISSFQIAKKYEKNENFPKQKFLCIRNSWKIIFIEVVGPRSFWGSLGTLHKKFPSLGQQFSSPLLAKAMKGRDFLVLLLSLGTCISNMKWSWKKIKYIMNIYCSRKCDSWCLLLPNSKNWPRYVGLNLEEYGEIGLARP